MHLPRFALLPALFLIGCSSAGGGLFAQERPFQVETVATFDEPWAMTFLPGGGGAALVTEKRGHLRLWTQGGQPAIDVAGVPAVAYGGQGGLADVVLHPDFARNRLVYLSYAEPGPGDASAGAVARGTLVVEHGAARLDNFQVIWRQQPRMDGGQYALRLAFGPDHMLYVSSGERQHFDPAQDISGNLGKIVRLRDDGTPAPGNPWSVQGGVAAQIWTLGHRNPLGLAFAPDGRLWENEMGPRGGDELNLIRRGANYGWPRASNGSHYDGRDIPDHRPGDGFEPPKVFWNPSVSPSSLIIYTGSMFPQWRGDALIGALSGQALIHVDIDGVNARKADQWDMGRRIREVEQGPDGAVYLLEDGEQGRLLRLTPSAARGSSARR